MKVFGKNAKNLYGIRVLISFERINLLLFGNSLLSPTTSFSITLHSGLPFAVSRVDSCRDNIDAINSIFIDKKSAIINYS